MLQCIEKDENSFTNPVKDMGYDDYKLWLIQQDDWSRGINLEKGYVPQTIYWLYVDDKPVGIGKIRHSLTDSSREFGGNVGYAISNKHRGNGYGTILLKKLFEQCVKLNVKEVLLSVEKYNYASKTVIEKCGGKLVRENQKGWFYKVEEMSEY